MTDGCPCPSEKCKNHGNCADCIGRNRSGKKIPYCIKSRSDDGRKTITIDYLFLDLIVCDRCIGTDKVLKNAVERVRPLFASIGCNIELRNTEIVNAEMAKEYRFRSSPTILINGNDICHDVTENRCGCCGEISGTDVDCRVFMYKGKGYEVPPEEMLVEAIMKNAFTDKAEPKADYELPKNLEDFFRGKEFNIPMIRRCC